MKIRLKVKHLVLIIAIVLAFIPLMIFIIGPQINLYMTEKRLDKGDIGAKEDLVKILDGNVLQSQKWKVIQEYMLGDSSHRFDVYVGPSFSSQPSAADVKTNFNWPEKLPYMQEYIKKGPINGFLHTAAKDLSAYYEKQGQLEKAEKVLSNAADRFPKGKYDYHPQELQLERVKLLLRQGKPQKAEKYLLNEVDNLDADNNYMKGEIAQLHTQIIMQKGNSKEAYQKIKKELAAYDEEDTNDSNATKDNDAEYEQLQSLERRLIIALNQHGDAIVDVSGKMVRTNGEPVKHAGVFLRDQSAVNSSVSEDEPYQTTTDENGNYEFHGVLSGSYQVFLGFTYEQIDGWTWPVEMNDWVDIDGKKDITYDITLNELLDIETPVNKQKITDETVYFEWEEVEDAAYYNLNVGVDIDSGSISTNFKTHIKDTQLTVPIEELYDKQTGAMFGDEEGGDPLQLLGFTNPENRFSWNVEAYDSDNNLITRSNGYRLNEETIGDLPFFYLQERELTDADRLLLDEKWKAALSAYMEKYGNNPDDLQSLRMIPRLIGMKGDGTSEKREELAYPYIKALAKKTNSEQYITDLVQYYYDHQEWDSFQKWFEQYSDLVDGNPDDYMQGVYANSLMKQKKLQSAREAFKKAMKMDDGNRFVGNWLAVEIYLGDSFDMALDIAKTNPEHPLEPPVRENYKDWEELVANLKEERRSHSNTYNQELKDILELYFEDNEEKLSDWLDTTDKHAMKAFIKALREID